jgi:tetraacyldisaccharide 4'-kinase
MRKLLTPFSLIYGAITSLRNLLFSKKYLDVYQPSMPTIAIGNLNTGGTGKTPMTEFLLKHLPYHSAVVISRGYGRKTKGLQIVDKEGIAADFGDEALQIAQKFPKVQVIVAEKRKLALEAAREFKADLALLDDAYQHRSVQADTYILLSAYHSLFSKDLILPAGNLRESRRGAKRSQAIVVTKCPSNILLREKEEIRRAISRYSTAPIYFSTLKYSELQNPFGTKLHRSKAILFSGIASPEYMEEHLKTLIKLVDKHQFKDHHSFTNNDLKTLLAQAKKEEAVLICSEKDYVKIASLGLKQALLKNIFILRVEHFFLDQDKERFLGQLSSIISARK